MKTVFVPSLKREVVVSKIENNVPVEGKYIDDKGTVQVVDLITTSWQLVSVVKKIWSLIKTIFKF
jgi:hypothetical protein